MLNKRKEKIKNIILNNNKICSHVEMYSLVNNGTLNYIINYIDDKPIECSEYTSKKKKLNGEEGFVYALDHYVSFFEANFYYLSRNKLEILNYIFSNKNNSIFLISNDNWDDNDRVAILIHTMKRVMVTNFYFILLELNKTSKTIKKFLKQQNIDIENYKLTEITHVNNLFELLKKLSFALVKTNQYIYLFRNISDIEEEQDNNEYISTLLLTERVIIEKAIDTYKVLKKEIETFC